MPARTYHLVLIECASDSQGPCFVVNPDPVRVAPGDFVVFLATNTKASISIDHPDITNSRTRSVPDFSQTGRRGVRLPIRDDAPQNSADPRQYTIHCDNCDRRCGPPTPPVLICE